MAGNLELVKRHRSHGGSVEFYRHDSRTCAAPMRFSVYRPPQAETGAVPVLYWLSGLTCSEENFMAKAGAQRYAAEHGILLVAPDTSPRDLGLPGETDSYDFGAGASFYVNATEAPWSAHYRMYDYVVEELPAVVAANFPVRADCAGIFGHSMGGHGALVVALRNPERYRSVSAFAPIAAPSLCPWGRKAFTGYLGPDESRWREYDAHELIKTAERRLPMLIDQGADDEFLQGGQLLPEKLVEAARGTGYPLTFNRRDGYDHSYYFIASFMREHFAHHAAALCARRNV
ncbi:MAG: S-formylglutathione hydrolase [Gammaproteobacteria bacterium]